MSLIGLAVAVFIRAGALAGWGVSPVAIPDLVTPMAVAILVIFVSYFPGTGDKIAVMGVAAAIMTLNFGVVLGAVLGVLRVAMDIEMIISGIVRSRIPVRRSDCAEPHPDAIDAEAFPAA